MFFTDEEPAGDQIGTKHHFFGRPSIRGYKQNPFKTPVKEEVFLQNPEAASVLRRIFEIDQQLKLDLEAKFQQYDPQGSGVIKKADFVNVIFENIRGIQASELLNFLNLFTTTFEDAVNYDDFLKLLYKFGSGEADQQDLAIEQGALLARLKPKDREVTEKIRSALKGQPIEEVLRRLSSGGKDVTEEDLIIGVSKLNANLYLNDLKDFISVVKSLTGSQDNKISLADTMQLLHQ